MRLYCILQSPVIVSKISAASQNFFIFSYLWVQFLCFGQESFLPHPRQCAQSGSHQLYRRLCAVSRQDIYSGYSGGHW